MPREPGTCGWHGGGGGGHFLGGSPWPLTDGRACVAGPARAGQLARAGWHLPVARALVSLAPKWANAPPRSLVTRNLGVFLTKAEQLGFSLQSPFPGAGLRAWAPAASLVAQEVVQPGGLGTLGPGTSALPLPVPGPLGGGWAGLVPGVFGGFSRRPTPAS